LKEQQQQNNYNNNSGFAAAVLQEWKRFYPNSEETNKTMGFKLAKYDRMPDEENVAIRVTPKGRTVWSQVMLKHLAEARKLAIEEVSHSEFRFFAPKSFQFGQT
jgi:hypothetical protein